MEQYVTWQLTSSKPAQRRKQHAAPLADDKLPFLGGTLLTLFYHLFYSLPQFSRKRNVNERKEKRNAYVTLLAISTSLRPTLPCSCTLLTGMERIGAFRNILVFQISTSEKRWSHVSIWVTIKRFMLECAPACTIMLTYGHFQIWRLIFHSQ